MPLPRASLRSFLSSAKSALNNAAQQSSPVTFVIGNESADLDSLCSAVVLAYIRTYSLKSKTFYIPLSNIPRADLNLRPELLSVLSHANLRPSDLITLSDLPSITSNSSRLSPEKTKWVLVDHNVMVGELGKIYGDQLVACIDHHDEENKVPKDTAEEPRIVQKCGSCSSLVVQYGREAWDSLASKTSQDHQAKWNAELARLALAPILIDTSNLKDESKTTPVDVEVVKYLQHWITSEEEGPFDAEDYFKEIADAEKDVDSMSLVDLLRKDYKEWNDGGVPLGICSVVKDMPFLVKKAGGTEQFLSAVKDFAKERKLSVCSVMTRTLNNGVFSRELLVWGFGQKGIESAKSFEQDAKPKLDLQTWKDGSLDLDNNQWCRCWSQGKAQDSRKQVAPLLRTAISG
ncbi:DHH phosphoesterase [Mollisia scopiformis]|uniref:DHH phosphoesterase n=1 Tax=Mollisia scopiformis TaxID=149040 RepID=A0A194X7L7_MOLSC|nr:DHH phosphoesterase [Mollisia scopiformis]KUJ16165.1 DHH phosphoesterase [Mollisia scopiformis]